MESAQADAKYLHDPFAQALQDEGLDQKSYLELYNQNPDFAKQSIQQSIRSHTKRMRDAKGSFVKAQPGQQGAPQQLSHDQVRSQAYQRQVAQDAGVKKDEVIRRMKEKSQKQLLSDDDILEIIDAGIGPLF
jgi:DNA-directed RNA polymerase specialized sigma subunit